MPKPYVNKGTGVYTSTYKVRKREKACVCGLRMRHSCDETWILNSAHQRMAAACVGRWLLQASNVISRQPVPSKIGGELPGTAATLLGTRCVTSAKQFSTSTVCHHQDDSTPEKALFRPRRTLMYVPASDERKTKKATSLRVDTIVFDLEDGVALNQKVCLNPRLPLSCRKYLMQQGRRA